MKQLLTVVAIACLGIFGFTGTALADKTVVAHCGCNFDGTDLEWVFLDVNTNSKGHQQHLDGDLEDCFDEFAVFVDVYERDFDDCGLIGETNLPGVSTCNPDPVEGASCSD